MSRLRSSGVAREKEPRFPRRVHVSRAGDDGPGAWADGIGWRRTIQAKNGSGCGDPSAPQVEPKAWPML